MLGQFAKFRIADFGHFALNFGPYPSTTFLLFACLFKQTQLPEEVSGVEIGNDHLTAILILDQDGD